MIIQQSKKVLFFFFLWEEGCKKSGEGKLWLSIGEYQHVDRTDSIALILQTSFSFPLVEMLTDTAVGSQVQHSFQLLIR